MIDIKVPTVGESISEVTLLKWVKNDGEYVNRDEVIAELESEKATFEVNAEKAGVLKQGNIKEGDTIKIGDILASIDESGVHPKDPVESSESGVGSSEPGVGSGKPAKQPAAGPAPPEKKISSNGKAKKEVKATPVAKEIIEDKK